MKTKLIALMLLCGALCAFGAERKLTLPKPEFSLKLEAGVAEVCLRTGQGDLYEVQRKSGRVLSRWRTVGYITIAPGKPPCFQDEKPPTKSKWRIRGIATAGGRSPFSNAKP